MVFIAGIDRVSNFKKFFFFVIHYCAFVSLSLFRWRKNFFFFAYFISDTPTNASLIFSCFALNVFDVISTSLFFCPLRCFFMLHSAHNINELSLVVGSNRFHFFFSSFYFSCSQLNANFAIEMRPHKVCTVVIMTFCSRNQYQ